MMHLPSIEPWQVDANRTTNIDRIRTLAGELAQLGKSALEKAIEAGSLLKECKAGLEHGQWLPWLKSNFSFTDRTARGVRRHPSPISKLERGPHHELD